MAWCSDWNGYEIGFPECSVVGLYQKEIDHLCDEEGLKSILNVYTNTETGEVLEIWTSEF